jgi:hypothetical protein
MELFDLAYTQTNLYKFWHFLQKESEFFRKTLWRISIIIKIECETKHVHAKFQVSIFCPDGKF